MPTSDCFGESLEAVERAMTSAAGGDARSWSSRMASELEALRSVFGQHVRDAEAPDGIFAEIDPTRPALQRRVGELRLEHQSLLELVRELADEARKASNAEVPGQPSSPSAGGAELLCRRVAQLLERMQHHREHETDLVQDTITTDLGAAD